MVLELLLHRQRFYAKISNWKEWQKIYQWYISKVHHILNTLTSLSAILILSEANKNKEFIVLKRKIPLSTTGSHHNSINKANLSSSRLHQVLVTHLLTSPMILLLSVFANHDFVSCARVLAVSAPYVLWGFYDATTEAEASHVTAVITNPDVVSTQ